MASNRQTAAQKAAKDLEAAMIAESNMANEAAKQPPMGILQKAHSLIYADRQADYGPALKNFEDIADQWSVTLGIPVTADQVAICMIQVKLARLMKSPDHIDSWVDVAGYAGCKQKMIDGD